MTDHKDWSDKTPEERAEWLAMMHKQAADVEAKQRAANPRIGLRVKGLRTRGYNG